MIESISRVARKSMTAMFCKQLSSRRLKRFSTMMILCSAVLLSGQTGSVVAQTISTVAGNGIGTFGGDDGPATAASLQYPGGVVVDGAGNILIADTYNHRIRRVDRSTGMITTVAGNGAFGFSGNGGPATAATLSEVLSVALDNAGNILIVDRNMHCIRRVDAITTIITTVTGMCGVGGFSGDGGLATAARLFIPDGVVVDSAGNLFVADALNNRIRRVDASTGIITTVAGNGSAAFGGDNGPATAAALSAPSALAVDAAGNLIISDTNNNRIRRVNAFTGIITTVAGNGTAGFSGDNGPATAASLNTPVGVAVDSAGNLLFAEYYNNRIRRVDASTGIITTVVGNGTAGFSGDGGPATSASLNTPYGVTVDAAGNLLFTDSYNHRVRRVVGLGASSIPLITNAGPDQSVNESTAVTLDGTGSTGQDITFNWQQIAGPTAALSNPTSSTPTFTAPQLQGGFGSQVMTFQLTVTSGNQSATDSVNVTVVNINHAPEAYVGANQIVDEASSVTLDGRASFDPDSDPISYQWVQTSGPAVSLTGTNTAQASFIAPLIPGGVSGPLTLTFSLTVSDGELSGTTQSTVTVDNVDHAPVADPGDPQTVHSGKLVTLNGSASSDPDGDPITYQWVQVSGPVVQLANAATASPSFTAPPVNGTTALTFRLVVNDSLLTSSPEDVVVTIKNGPPLCNLARAVPDVLWPPNHTMVPIGITGITDPEDNMVAITITQITQDETVNGLGDGDTSPDASIQDGNLLLRAERSAKGNGRVYKIGFTANDGEGGTCTGAVKVGVPLSLKRGMEEVDDGQLYVSTQP